jgi:uncharacterized protein
VGTPARLKLGADAARRFLVRRHLLAPPRALPAAAESVLEVVRRLGSLQFDPLETPGARNHDLVLHARIAGYRRAWCERWLYGKPEERRLFEAYNKSLNILPLDELPWFRAAWTHAQARYRDRVLRPHAKLVQKVLARIEREGPLSTAAFSREDGLSHSVDWWWAPTRMGRVLVEALFCTGRIAIARREGNLRHYDLAERVFPPEILGQRASRPEALRHRLLSRHRGVGLLGDGSTSEIVASVGTARERAAATARLVRDGALVPAEVEGLRGTRYLLAEELPLLDDATPVPPAVTFLAPLDPFMWDRRLVRALFGFDYIWEVYTPVHKRRHGYYVLPVLFADRLVGRIEFRKEKAEPVLRVLSLRWEKGFRPGAAATSAGARGALTEAIEAYRVFVGAERVAWPRGAAATLRIP